MEGDDLLAGLAASKHSDSGSQTKAGLLRRNRLKAGNPGLNDGTVRDSEAQTCEPDNTGASGSDHANGTIYRGQCGGAGQTAKLLIVDLIHLLFMFQRPLPDFV